MSRPRSLTEIQELTRAYAAYEKSHGGLGHVLGGAVGLALSAIVLWMPPGTPASVLAVALTLSWVAGKEWLRRRLYRRFGEAQEVMADRQRRDRRTGVLAITLGMAALGLVVIATGGLHRLDGWVLLIASALTPVIAWRRLFTTEELMVGFGVLFFTAVVLTGNDPGLFLLPFWFVPIYSLVLIRLGLVEHRRFQALTARLHRGEA